MYLHCTYRSIFSEIDEDERRHKRETRPEHASKDSKSVRTSVWLRLQGVSSQHLLMCTWVQIEHVGNEKGVMHFGMK